jgi:hypothetical protein
MEVKMYWRGWLRVSSSYKRMLSDLWDVQNLLFINMAGVLRLVYNYKAKI